ncbi:MAG: hypothetical protein U5Q44_01790 [Dehalococcoidia bacterium]|nr:hypothetical protein [Dehalococcoidia bacterium]
MPPRDPFTPTTTPTLDPVEDITRRRLLTALPALGLIAGGISCGDDDDEPAPTEAPTEAPSTRVVEHPLGTTELPMQPARPLDASWASDVVEVAAELSIALVGMRYVEYYTTAFQRGDRGCG